MSWLVEITDCLEQMLRGKYLSLHCLKEVCCAFACLTHLSSGSYLLPAYKNLARTTRPKRQETRNEMYRSQAAPGYVRVAKCPEQGVWEIFSEHQCTGLLKRLSLDIYHDRILWFGGFQEGGSFICKLFTW